MQGHFERAFPFRRFAILLILVWFIVGVSGGARAQGCYYGPGYADPFDGIFQDLQQSQNYYMQQMDAIGQQIQAQLDRINRYFIDLYRKTTGDTQSPDSVALHYGQVIHCQRYPLDCQLALQGSQQSMAAPQANFQTHQQMMQERSATSDAAFAAWMQGQSSQHQAHQGFIQGVIQGEANYTAPNTGTTYSLPFAPSQNTYYQAPDGSPLFFDPTFNIWYKLESSGSYTPYYGAP